MATVLFIVGATAIVAGVALLSAPAAFIVAGLLACALAVLVERGDA